MMRHFYRFVGGILFLGMCAAAQDAGLEEEGDYSDGAGCWAPVRPDPGPGSGGAPGEPAGEEQGAGGAGGDVPGSCSGIPMWMDGFDYWGLYVDTTRRVESPFGDDGWHGLYTFHCLVRQPVGQCHLPLDLGYIDCPQGANGEPVCLASSDIVRVEYDSDRHECVWVGTGFTCDESGWNCRITDGFL